MSPSAIVSLITSDSYYPGIQVLVKSVRRHCSHPVLVLVGQDVSEATRRRIESLGVAVKVVPNIGSPRQSHDDAPWLNSQYTKLHIWNLIEFERVVYIDADCLVCANIDELFSLSTDFAASPDIFPPDRFNAGVLVITPSESSFQSLLSAIPTTPSYDGGDTGFLNGVCKDWYHSPNLHTRLPFAYNAQRTMYHFTKKNPGYWQAIQPVKIIHYSSSPKPWEANPFTGKAVGELEQLWWNEFMS
eukprot:gene25615-30935_t